MTRALLVLALLFPALRGTCAEGGAGEWLLKFSAFPSRYIGTPGQRATLDEVEAGFRSFGLKGVRRETVRIVAPVESEAWIEGAGFGRTTLHMVWPNHVQLSAELARERACRWLADFVTRKTPCRRNRLGKGPRRQGRRRRWCRGCRALDFEAAGRAVPGRDARSTGG